MAFGTDDGARDMRGSDPLELEDRSARNVDSVQSSRSIGPHRRYDVVL
jgi:hypothetical protein